MPFNFSKAKEQYERSRLPANWPSYLHGKCDIALCKYPNPPQAAEGKYSCLGKNGGYYCEGSYRVSKSMADTVMRDHRKQMKKDDEAREKAAYDAEIARQKNVQDELDEEARRQAAVDVARHRAAEKSRRNGGLARDYIPITGLSRSDAQRKALERPQPSRMEQWSGYQPPTRDQVALYPSCTQQHVHDKQYTASSSAFVNPRPAPRPLAKYTSATTVIHSAPYPMPQGQSYNPHRMPNVQKPSRRKF